ncbi:peptidoglycan recognition protein family protein [Dolichospermum sp. ST_sed1]|nr:peptidoglycan recognition protein family protein [Dolichospermum sp. ST_sed1]MDD1423004.1 peptidoglycan recognition protein family protein [Dolichospermum sp. ST_sed9]MDD1431799.1 peptidoglycan recognition protein family protein [Dolichospermum sp. ST_sed6]MDD1440749.1 peptidoglycan recognition protein family protein [Dolichospermum sp. ST_sed3]MDD1444896.1 peptidoglycan recognition protein family protein [Dolichospermum sp. ST_sed8]MDD1453497.1 peptidoglycan recognition protein family prot
MRFREWATRVILIFLMLATLILAIFMGGARKLHNQTIASTSAATTWNQYLPTQLKSSVTTQQKKRNLVPSPVKIHKINPIYTTTIAFAKYRPNFAQAKVDPSNYGDRYTADVNGVPFNHQPIIVLHETTNSTSSAINFFQTPHDDESVQASYHAIITLEGQVIYLVPPEKRAFGAGNSVFKGANGVETVQTNPNLPPSVNNFAYHVSLETPPDAWGKSDIKEHSGYTEAQYNSLAWLIAQSQVSDDRITTHEAVDVGNGKVDPLSFDFDKFFHKLHSFRQLETINNAKM